MNVYFSDQGQHLSPVNNPAPVHRVVRVHEQQQQRRQRLDRSSRLNPTTLSGSLLHRDFDRVRPQSRTRRDSSATNSDQILLDQSLGAC